MTDIKTQIAEAWEALLQADIDQLFGVSEKPTEPLTMAHIEAAIAKVERIGTRGYVKVPQMADMVICHLDDVGDLLCLLYEQGGYDGDWVKVSKWHSEPGKVYTVNLPAKYGGRNV